MFENLSHHVRGGNKSDRLYVVSSVLRLTHQLLLGSYKFRNFASKERIFISSLVPYERYKVSSLSHFYNSFNLPPKFSFCYSVIFVLWRIQNLPLTAFLLSSGRKENTNKIKNVLIVMLTIGYWNVNIIKLKVHLKVHHPSPLPPITNDFNAPLPFMYCCVPAWVSCWQGGCSGRTKTILCWGGWDWCEWSDMSSWLRDSLQSVERVPSHKPSLTLLTIYYESCRHRPGA